MNGDVDGYKRWRAAEASDRDDDADDAFGAVFQSVVEESPVSMDFTAETMAAIRAASLVDARRARLARAGVLSATGASTIAAIYFGSGWAVSSRPPSWASSTCSSPQSSGLPRRFKLARACGESCRVSGERLRPLPQTRMSRWP